MDIKNFGDFFHVETATKQRGALIDIPRRNPNETRSGRKINSWIGNYVQIDGSSEYPYSFDYFYCAPNDNLIEIIENNMITVDYDTIYFNIILFKDYAVLRARYGQILGSRVIARIQHDSIPFFSSETQKLS